MIIRGTTPTHYFKFPLAFNDMSEMVITYYQRNKVRVEKHLPDIKYQSEDETISIILTQEDSLQLLHSDRIGADNDVEIQIKCKDKYGKVYASRIIKTTVEKILNEKVL